MTHILKLFITSLVALTPSIGFAQIAAEFTPVSTIIGALPGGLSFGAQTFTVLQGGLVSSVEVLAQSFGMPPSSLQIELLATSAGKPVGGPGGVLASVSLPGSVLPSFGSTSYLSVDFSSFAIPLLVGGQYAISISGTSTYAWLGVDNGYSGGSMYTSSDSGSTYSLFPTPAGDRDLAFRVNVAAVPETSAAPLILLVAVALPFQSVIRRKLTTRS